MPNYLRTVAKNRSEALQQIEKKLGHKDITILREGVIVDKKRKWFRTVEEKVYYIECVEYYKKSNSSLQEKPPTNQVTQPSISLQANLTQAEPNPVKIQTPNQLEALVASINQRSNQENTSIKNSETNIRRIIGSKETSNSNRANNSYNNPISTKKISHEANAVSDFLLNRDFSPKFTSKITDYFALNKLYNKEDYFRLAEHISSFCKFTGMVKTKSDQPHYVFVVGPTGVGKTTTLSKIASIFYTDEDHYPKPSLIKFASLDAKRIMAMEQLRKFANILSLPFKSIYGVDDFKKLYRESKKKELILVDTSGVSKQDTALINEIAVFTRSLKSSKEIHLCLNASCRYYDLKKSYEVLSKTKPDRILITKIDESYSLGSILSFIDEVQLPISYITNGQDVPIDILSADKDKIKNILLKEWGL